MPYKNPVDNVRWAYTAEKYNQPFDLDTIADELGYPLYMKPFDGGGWRGVSRINDRDDLHRAYDESGEMLMHLQATVDYEHFARALSIGPETMVMDFRPDEPMHNRYAVSHGFLSRVRRHQTRAISRIVNAFFGWEFNSAEMLVAGRRGLPDRLRQRLPRRRGHLAALLLPVGDHGAGALVGLLRWSTGRSGRVDLHTARYFAIADDESLSLRREDRPPTWRWPTSTSRPTRYWQWCAEHLPHLDGAGPRLGDVRRLRPAAARDRGRDVPRRTSRSSSWPTSRASSTSGQPTTSTRGLIRSG